jgi:phosphotriesterase-related protein
MARSRLSRSDLAGKVQSVRGLLDPAELGQTLMHEHVLWDLRTPEVRAKNDLGPELSFRNIFQMAYGETYSPRNMLFDDVAIAIDELQMMRDVGGQTVVELTCGGIRPDPKGLAQVSEGTSVNIVMGCGYYVEEYQDPKNKERSADDFAAEMAAQVLEGAWGTSVRSGIIGEIGTTTPWGALERTVLKGALLAQQETGASVNIHPGRHEDLPQEIAEFVAANGGNTSRTVISHIDRTIFDAERLLRLADTGVTVEFDLFGTEVAHYKLNTTIDMPNDAVRLQHLRTLIAAGHLDRIVISHDICQRTRLTNFGGHGYGHIFRNVVPMMRRREFSEAEIQAILVDNPRRLLTFA